MFSSSSVLRVSLCLLLCLRQCLAPEVKTGEDTTLLCQGPRDAEITVIMWNKSGLESEQYVFIYRDKRADKNSQHESYRGRVELKDPKMEDGDVSVVLKNVTVNDAGTYECRVKGEDGPEQTSYITLTVQIPVTIRAGQSVSLPCRAPSNTDITGVEWKRPGLEPEYIFVYRDGNPDPHNQHPSFKGRVELKDGEMKDGDVSMILKNVTIDDTGTYECRVFHTETTSSSGSSSKNELISIINLEVQSGDTEEIVDKKGGDKALQIGLGVGLTLLVVVVVGVVGFIIYQRINQKSDRAAYTAARTG